MTDDAGGPGGVSAAPTSGALAAWWRGARPRTLGAGLVPVVLGTAAAGQVIWWRFAAALVVAAGLQVGVNYANDYFDGVRGVDTGDRLGPPRLTATGAVSPRAVLAAALVSLGVAAIAGLALALATEPVLILFVGALALVAAVLYSGGPRPYAGLGLGELMVFAFFGLMATCGTAFVMVETVPAEAWWGGGALGFLAVAILVANNLRDIGTDAASGKRTLAVRIGDTRTRALYRAAVVAGFATIAVGVIVGIAVDGAGLPQWALFGLGGVGARDPPDGSGRLRDRPRPDSGAHRHGRDPRRARPAHRARLRARHVGSVRERGACVRVGGRLMEGADLNLACAWALVDGLVAGGLRHACVSPGSRSTSLAVAFARHPVVTVQVHLDERSAGFVAAGIARVTGAPVALACTSGTAAAEYLPAVVEASQSRLPLVVLTADRPPRLRGTGANQTIDQVGLYGGNVRGSLDLPVPEAAGQEAWWRQASREALEAALVDPVGPVHVNCPFEEPLSPSAAIELPAPTGEALELPARAAADLTAEEADRLAELVSGARGAVVIGPAPQTLAAAAGFWSRRLGWPVIAEPTSGARHPGLALAAGQALIGDAAWAGSHRPEVVIQFGAAPTTRATQAFVASAERLVVADRWHLDPDPDRLAAWRIAVDADALAAALADRSVDREEIGISLTGSPPVDELGAVRTGHVLPATERWVRAWTMGTASPAAALDGFLDGVDEPFEPRVARDVAADAPEGGTLLVGNSTPIRDLDLAMAPRDGLRVLANRGASGIDGLVSTAIGAASATGPPVALLGDLAVLARPRRRGVERPPRRDATLVVVNNGGGQIFAALPQRDLPEHKDLFITPHEADSAASPARRAPGTGAWIARTRSVPR